MTALREVPGPSATGGGWRRSLELLWLIAVADFKRVYLGTVLGALWSICRPLLLFGVLLAVFTQAFRLGNSVPHYAALLLLNIVLFGFFQESTTGAVGSIVAQESIVRKTQFPRVVIPLAVVVTSAFNLGLNLLVVAVFVIATGVTPTLTWLLLPLLVVVLAGFTVSVSMLVAALYPRFRDVGIIWSVAATALLYATPVLYPIGYVSDRLRDVLLLNPLAPVFELAHRWLIDSDAPFYGGWRLAVSVAIYVVVVVVSLVVFWREAPRVAEAL